MKLLKKNTLCSPWKLTSETFSKKIKIKEVEQTEIYWKKLIKLLLCFSVIHSRKKKKVRYLLSQPFCKTIVYEIEMLCENMMSRGPVETIHMIKYFAVHLNIINEISGSLTNWMLYSLFKFHPCISDFDLNFLHLYPSKILM